MELFLDYQKLAASRVLYRTADQVHPGPQLFLAPYLELTTACGDVADELRVVTQSPTFRGMASITDRDAIAEALGEVLRVVAQISFDLGVPLADIAARSVGLDPEEDEEEFISFRDELIG